MTDIPLKLTVGLDTKDRLLAVISRGGHPQIPNTEVCEVLEVKIVTSVQEAKQWFAEMKIERPWETRQ